MKTNRAWFALAVLFIRGCERIVGPDVEAPRADLDAVAEKSVA